MSLPPQKQASTFDLLMLSKNRIIITIENFDGGGRENTHGTYADTAIWNDNVWLRAQTFATANISY